jgi:hypothetical protein
VLRSETCARRVSPVENRTIFEGSVEPKGQRNEVGTGVKWEPIRGVAADFFNTFYMPTSTGVSYARLLIIKMSCAVIFRYFLPKGTCYPVKGLVILSYYRL